MKIYNKLTDISIYAKSENSEIVIYPLKNQIIFYTDEAKIVIENVEDKDFDKLILELIKHSENNLADLMILNLIEKYSKMINLNIKNVTIEDIFFNYES